MASSLVQASPPVARTPKIKSLILLKSSARNLAFAAICISRSCPALRRARSNASCNSPTVSQSTSKRPIPSASPKLSLKEKPLEINKAERRELLRIPGIGPKHADAILQVRRTSKLRDLTALRKLGIVVARAAPFLLLNGRRPESQLVLF